MWCRENERRLREAVSDLATFNDTWPALANAANAANMETLVSWQGRIDGPGLASKLRSLRSALSGAVPAGAVASHPRTAAEIRDGALALLDELATVRAAVSTKALASGRSPVS